MADRFSKNSGIADVDRLVSRGSMDSLLYTLWIIIGAVTFGTIMEEFGMLTRLIDPVLPARMLRIEFQKRGLQPQNLSRLAADAGTVTSALIPWNSCSAFVAVTLGIPTFLYFSFAIFTSPAPFYRCSTALRASKLTSCPPPPALPPRL